jgi:hypothetical protein
MIVRDVHVCGDDDDGFGFGFGFGLAFAKTVFVGAAPKASVLSHAPTRAHMLLWSIKPRPVKFEETQGSEERE